MGFLEQGGRVDAPQKVATEKLQEIVSRDDGVICINFPEKDNLGGGTLTMRDVSQQHLMIAIGALFESLDDTLQVALLPTLIRLVEDSQHSKREALSQSVH